MPADQPDLPRRAAVAGVITTAVAAALAGCTKGKSSAVPTRAATPSAGSLSAGARPGETPSSQPTALVPDPAAVTAAITREIRLIAAYDAAAAEAPAAAGVLADFRSHHEAHLARVRALPGAPPDSSAAPLQPGGSRSPAASTAVRAALQALAGKENDAAAAGATASAHAGPTEFAQLLAEIAGNEAQHGALLPTFPAPAAR